MKHMIVVVMASLLVLIGASSASAESPELLRLTGSASDDVADVRLDGHAGVVAISRTLSGVADTPVTAAHEIVAGWPTGLSDRDLADVSGKGIMPGAPSHQTAGVVLWDERPATGGRIGGVRAARLRLTSGCPTWWSETARKSENRTS